MEGEEGSGLKGKAFQKASPGVSTDSNGGRLFLNTGAQSGRGGGVGDGPPEYQSIRERRDNPKGPERKQRLIENRSLCVKGPGILKNRKILKRGPVGDEFVEETLGKSCSLFCFKIISDKSTRVRNYS